MEGVLVSSNFKLLMNVKKCAFRHRLQLIKLTLQGFESTTFRLGAFCFNLHYGYLSLPFKKCAMPHGYLYLFLFNLIANFFYTIQFMGRGFNSQPLSCELSTLITGPWLLA